MPRLRSVICTPRGYQVVISRLTPEVAIASQCAMHEWQARRSDKRAVAEQPLEDAPAGSRKLRAVEPSTRQRASSSPVRRHQSPSALKSSPTGMRFDPVMTLDTWKSVGRRIAMHSDASCWWLGDWLAFGRKNYGRRYKEGVALTGLEYQTLRNYTVVARAFEWSRRRDNLSFQHHAEVCSLSHEDQEYWLELSARNGWSKSELRRQLRARTTKPARPSPSPALHLVLESNRDSLWREAAERSSCPFPVWVMSVLDEAATAALEEPPPSGT
jgi:hypothetical protein